MLNRNLARLILRLTYQLLFLSPLNCYFHVKFLLGLFKEIEYDGNVVFGEKICVFASYPASGKLSKNLKIYISNLYRLGYSIIFISNCTIIAEDLEKLKTLCSKVIIRENFGRDFGGYKCGIIKYKDQIMKAEELLVANDSVLQILDLEKMFDEMHAKKIDFWGISESYNGGMYRNHHICSYFMLLSKKIINSEIFWDFWKNYHSTNSRKHIIQQGEINFSLVMQKAGFSMLAYINSFNLYQYLIKNKKNLSFFINYSYIRHNNLKINMNSMANLLYNVNHNGVFLKAMINIGLLLIKKDVFSRCGYFVYEISQLLQEKEYANSDEIIQELLLQVKQTHTLKDRILTIIGEK